MRFIINCKNNDLVYMVHTQYIFYRISYYTKNKKNMKNIILANDCIV